MSNSNLCDVEYEDQESIVVSMACFNDLEGIANSNFSYSNEDKTTSEMINASESECCNMQEDHDQRGICKEVLCDDINNMSFSKTYEPTFEALYEEMSYKLELGLDYMLKPEMEIFKYDDKATDRVIHVSTIRQI